MKKNWNLIRLFESVNGVQIPQESMLKENEGKMDLPIGFDQDDVMSVEEFYELDKDGALNEDKEDLLGAETRPKSAVDSFLKKRMDMVKNPKNWKDEKKKQAVLKGNPYLHTSTITGRKATDKKKEKIGIVDQTGSEIDQDALKALLSKRPSNVVAKDSNDKMTKTGAVKITLPKYMGFVHDEKNNDLKIVKTCTKAKDCIKHCYAGKGNYVQWDVSSEKSGQILTYLLNDSEGWKNQVISEIQGFERANEKTGMKTIVRWHDSGDFISDNYIQLAIEVAKATPNVKHYAYTKEVSKVKGANFPKNFIINYSYGGKEDNLIDPTKDRHSRVVKKYDDPKETDVSIDFKRFYDKRKNKEDKDVWVEKSSQLMQEFKQELAQKYKLDPNSVITYRELLQKKESDKQNYYNVIVTPKDADTAAFREDVLGIYLIYH